MSSEPVDLRRVSDADLLWAIHHRKRETPQPWVLVEALLCLLSDDDISHLRVLASGRYLDEKYPVLEEDLSGQCKLFPEVDE